MYFQLTGEKEILLWYVKVSCWTQGSCAPEYGTDAKQIVKHCKATTREKPDTEKSLDVLCVFASIGFDQWTLTNWFWLKNCLMDIVSIGSCRWCENNLQIHLYVFHEQMDHLECSVKILWWDFHFYRSFTVVRRLVICKWTLEQENRQKIQCFHHSFSDFGIFLHLFSLFDKYTKNLRKMEFFHLFICFFGWEWNWSAGVDMNCDWWILHGKRGKIRETSFQSTHCMKRTKQSSHAYEAPPPFTQVFYYFFVILRQILTAFLHTSPP